MRTNHIPGLITLSAGLIDCIFSIKNHLSMYDFTKRLLLVLFIFYIIGCFVQLITKKSMKALADKVEEENKEENGKNNGKLENINSTEE